MSNLETMDMVTNRIVAKLNTRKEEFDKKVTESTGTIEKLNNLTYAMALNDAIVITLKEKRDILNEIL